MMASIDENLTWVLLDSIQACADTASCWEDEQDAMVSPDGACRIVRSSCFEQGRTST